MKKEKIAVITIIVLGLFILSIAIGFFETKPHPTEKEVCVSCRTEGVFNPVLRPFSFLIGNVYQGLMVKGGITYSNVKDTYFLYMPFDVVYWVVIGHVIYERYYM